jgi:TonB family protein
MPCSRRLPSRLIFLPQLAALLLMSAPASAQRAACTPVPVASTRSLPEWPPGARQANAQGTVTLEVTIARNGHASRARVIKSSGFPGLDEAAANHVRQKYLWQPLACAPEKTIVKVVWDPAGLCAIGKRCAWSPN